MSARAPIPLGRLERGIVDLCFMLLFPGFFFYHTLLGLGVTGAFLGGYFAPVALLFVLPLCFIYGFQLKRDPHRLAAIDIYFGLFLAYFFAVVMANAVFAGTLASAAKHVIEIVFLVDIFLMFKLIDFAGAEFRRPALMSLLAMSAIVFYFSVDGVFYLGAQGIAKDAESLATYQGFSRSYLFTILAVIPFTPALTVRAFFYIVGAAALFLNTARSEFAALLFVIPIIEFYHSRQKLYFILVIITIIVLIRMNMDQILAALPDNRILELVDLSHSSSANKRHYLSVHAWHTITAYPIFGDYASYAPGYYSHNILSAWVDLGLFGFIYILAVLIIPALPMFIKEYFAGRTCGDFVLGFSLMCVTVLLLISSHYFTDMLIGATVGAYSKYRYGKKYGNHRAPDVGPPALRHPDLLQAMPDLGRARP